MRNFEVPCSSVDDIVLHPRSIGTWNARQRKIHNDLKEALQNLPPNANVICQATFAVMTNNNVGEGAEFALLVSDLKTEGTSFVKNCIQASTKTHGKIQLAAAPESKVDSVKKDLQEGVANDRHRRSGSSFSRHRE